LSKFEIAKPLITCRDDSEGRVVGKILSLLEDGKNVCLISDAGTPCISDPGFRIVRACRKNGLPVITVPGPCAAIAALSVSGLPTDGFLFVGFLPAKTAARLNFFRDYHDFRYTIVFYESCHRIVKFLNDAHEVFGPKRMVCVARELTKLHEICHVGELLDVREKVAAASTRGEFVVIVAPEHFIF
jgi:16S rRNA (cytidine1402-2'-O)-methyltransferase